MEGVSSGENVHAETSDSVVKMMEIKIKTLDSQVYTCNVDQNMSVPALKEHIATLTGVPAVSQRLICRGKVLKDDHNLSAYNVEDGHTLHLVTRQVSSSSGTPSSSGGTGAAEEEQGGEGPSPALSRNRPTQISHSVVMGTFNVPDNGDGGLPDVNRILSSVLTSLGIANLVPTNAGANVGGPIGAIVNPPVPLPAVAGQEAGAGDGRPQAVAGAGHQPPSSERGGSQAAWPAAGPGTLPAMGQQFRILQQVIPDALTTISQYLDGLEQVLAANVQQASMPAASSVNTAPTQPSGSPATIRGHPTPANLGAVIQRTMRLINGQAGVELNRLSSQLENERNLADAGVRGELQLSALRDGVLLQQLGALLLELGRATLTLRMGTSPMESAVNAGPAVFISPAGPNPMMVQPLPLHQGAGFGTLSAGTHQNAGTMGSGEVPRNISIHIHANDTGTTSGPPVQVPVPPVQGVLNTFPSQVSSSITSTGLVSGPASTSIAGNIAPTVHAIPVPMQAGGSSTLSEQPGIRVVPMRTVVAAMPSTLQGRPLADITGAPSGLLHPLLARFQQLNSQQVSGSPAVVVHGIPPGSPVVPPSASMLQQSLNSIAPTIRAQVQVQAWVPDGQGGSRLVSNEEALRTLFTPTTQETASLNPQQQSSLSNRAVSQSNTLQETSNVTLDAGVNRPVDGQQSQMPNDAPEASIDSSQEQVHEVERKTCSQEEVEHGNGIKGRDHITDLLNGENNARAGTSSQSTGDKLQPKDRNMADIPAGLGLRGLQPLPSRIPKRSARQQQSPQATSTSGQAVQDQSTFSTHEREGLVPPATGGQNNTQGSPLIPDSSGTVPNQISQLLNHAPMPRGGGSNLDIGNLLSQFMGNSGGTNPSARARDIDQGLGLPAGGLGSLMGQVMQNPFMRNVVQQVVEQVGEGTLDHEDLMDQGASSQGGLDFSRLLQQMMPVVSQALSRVSATSSPEQASSLLQGIGARNRENGVVRGSTERISEGTNGLQDILSHGLDVSSGSNLSTIFQQMMPVVAQAFGGGLGGRPEQASSGVPFNVHARSEVNDGAGGTAGIDAHQLQEIPERSETSQLGEEQQESTPSERLESAPVAKRQKIDVERAVEKLEQGSSPDEILRVIAETAGMLVPNDNQEANTSLLAEHLCQDSCLVDDYMALLLRDLTSRIRADH